MDPNGDSDTVVLHGNIYRHYHKEPPVLQKIRSLFSEGEPSAQDPGTRARNRQRSRDTLAECDTTLDRLRAAVHNLERHRKNVLKYLDVLAALDTPVNSLPDDMLYLIIGIVADDEMFAERSLPAFQLALVCRRWRNISLSCPSLYKQVCMHAENVNGTLRHDALALQEYLQRSKKLPLTIQLLHQEYPVDEDDALLPPQFDNPLHVALTQESERWEDVRLKVRPNAYEGATFRAIQGRLPILRRLRLYMPFERPSGITQVPACFFDCPALEEIALDWEIMPSRVPPNAWPNLQKAFLVAPTWACVVEFLPQISSQLSWLIISDPRHRALGVSADIYFPSLETLCIQAIDGRSGSTHATSSAQVVAFLKNFTCPELEDLQIMFIEEDPGGMAYLCPSIHALLQRSSCTLRTLKMAVVITGGELETLLRQIPTLSTLDLYSIGSITEDDPGISVFMHALSLPFSASADPGFLPELDELGLVLKSGMWSNLSGGQSAHHLILDMLESRARCPDSLLAFVVLGTDTESTIDPQVLDSPFYNVTLKERIERLESNGMGIMFETESVAEFKLTLETDILTNAPKQFIG